MAVMPMTMLSVVVRLGLAGRVLHHEVRLPGGLFLGQTQHGSSHRAPDREHDHKQQHQPDPQVLHRLSLS